MGILDDCDVVRPSQLTNALRPLVGPLGNYTYRGRATFGREVDFSIKST